MRRRLSCPGAWPGLALLVLHCACRPPASGPADAGPDGTTEPAALPALLLDSDFRHSSAWIDVVAALRTARVEPVYRRFYPHLTLQDVTPVDGRLPYPLVVLALGRTPGNPGSQLRAGEMENARRFVEAGGVLVLAPQSGWRNSYSGESDFFVANRTLELLGVPVRIDKNTVIGCTWQGDPLPAHEPTDWCYPPPLEFNVGYPYVLAADGTRLAGGSVPTLRVASADVDVPLRTYAKGHLWELLGDAELPLLREERALAAIAKAGPGFVAVLPRGVLTLSAAPGSVSDKPAMDPERREVNRGWVASQLATLAGLARGSSAFRVTGTHAGDALFSVAAPDLPPLSTEGEVFSLGGRVSTRAVPAAPPAGDLVQEVPRPATGPRARPAWFSPGGGRVAYGWLPEPKTAMATVFDELTRHGFDAVMATTNPSRLNALTGAELQAEQAMYATLAAQAHAAGARLYLGDYYTNAYTARPAAWPAMVGAHGKAANAPAPLSASYWSDVLLRTCAAVGQLARAHPGIAGLQLDMELYNGPVWHHDGWAFGEPELEAYLATVDDDLLALSLREAAPADRLDLLVDRGLLKGYFDALEQAAADYGRRCREALTAHDQNQGFMWYLAAFPDTWFYRGLMRGMGTAEQPVVVLTYDGWDDGPVEALQAEGVAMAHLGGTILGLWKPSDFDDVNVSLSQGNDGYWLYPYNEISSSNASPPPLHGTGAQYWDAVDAAHERL